MKRILIVIILLGLPLPAAAQWSSDPLLNLSIADRASEQVVPKIAAAPDGSCYVAWFDHASGNYDVYLQRLDAAGNEQWAHNGIAVSTHPQNSSLVDWDLIADGAGNAVVVFTDARAGSDLDVYAYRVTAGGDMLWGADGIALSANADYEPSPRVTQAGDGDFVVIWPRLPDVGDGAIMMQRLAPDGTLRFAAGGIPVVAEPGEDPAFCDLVPAGAGDVILAWVRDISTFMSPRHLRAEKFGADGLSVWGASVSVHDQNSLPIAYQPELLPDGAGGAVLLWHRFLGSSYNSLVQRLDAAGAELWPHGGVEVSTLAGMNHISPSFTHDAATGDTYVFWDERNGSQSQWGVFGQRFDAAGVRLWGDGGLGFLPTDTLYKWAIRTLPAPGGAMVFWIDEPAGYGNDRVRGLRVDAAGSWQWGAAPVDVASLLSGKSRLPVAAGPTGAALLIWEDDRAGSVDVFGQSVNADGSLGGGATAVPEDTPAATISLAAFPNPFNPKTTIRFVLPGDSEVELSVFDLAGRQVETLLDQPMSKGSHEVIWRGRDNQDGAVTSGIYFARLSTGDAVLTRKLLLLK